MLKPDIHNLSNTILSLQSTGVSQKHYYKSTNLEGI